MKRTMQQLLFALLIGLGGSAASGGETPAELQSIQRSWGEISYLTPEKEKEAAFKQLAERAADYVARNPGKAEPLVWQGIILGSYAGAKGGLGALSTVRQARDVLLEAARLDPEALDGSAYNSLGSLYYKVPGWPLGFGDDDKARDYLHKALAINPNGIDPNYFYGEFLYEEGETDAAIRALNKALAAPDRPTRPIADAGRREEARALLARIQSGG